MERQRSAPAREGACTVYESDTTPRSAATILPVVLVWICAVLALSGCGSSGDSPSALRSSSVSSTQTRTPPASSAAAPATTPKATTTPNVSTTPKGATTPKGTATPAPPVSVEAKAVLQGFATCMRNHGIKYPELNLSGHGPAVDGAGVDRSTPKFRAAQLQCAKSMAAGLRALGIGSTQAPAG